MAVEWTMFVGRKRSHRERQMQRRLRGCRVQGRRQAWRYPPPQISQLPLFRQCGAARNQGSDGVDIGSCDRAELRSYPRPAKERRQCVLEPSRRAIEGGTSRAQQVIRWNLFQLSQASERSEGHGIAARGLTGRTYEGHYFWDTEIYVLPFLIYTPPHVANSLLKFRYDMLDEAGARAMELGQRGATFPWRTINGEEASAFYAAGTAEYHINADIAYALRKYVEVSGDDEFLRRLSSTILVETARFWYDLGFFSARKEGRFCINGVTGPDEYSALVNNNYFTESNGTREPTLRRHHCQQPRAQRSEQLSGTGGPYRTCKPRAKGLAGRRRQHVPATRRTVERASTGRRFLRPGAMGTRWHPRRRKLSAPAALSSPRIFTGPGHQAGRYGNGHVFAGRAVHVREQTAQFRLLRPTHDVEFVAFRLQPGGMESLCIHGAGAIRRRHSSTRAVRAREGYEPRSSLSRRHVPDVSSRHLPWRFAKFSPIVRHAKLLGPGTELREHAGRDRALERTSAAVCVCATAHRRQRAATA